VNRKTERQEDVKGKENIIRIYEKSLSFSGSIAVRHLKHSVNNVIHPKDINFV